MTNNIPLNKRRIIYTSLCSGGIILTLCTVTFFALVLGSAISPLQSNKGDFNTDSLLKIITYTLQESLCSTLLALIIGFFTSYFVSNYNFFSRRFLLSLSSIPLCLPPLIIALGYITTFGMAGIFNKIFMTAFHATEPPIQFLYSFWGIVITQGFYNSPLVMATISDSWMTISHKEEDASLILGARPFRTFRKITFYKLLPSIMSSAIIVFLFCFFSFMIVLLFGVPGGTTLEVAIYHAAKSSLNPKGASLLAIIETLCALSIVAMYTLIEEKGHRTKSSSFAKKIKPSTSMNTRQKVAFVILFMIITFFLLIPLFSIIYMSMSYSRGGKTLFGFETWLKLFKMRGFAKSIKNTFITGCATAVLSTIVAFTAASFVRLHKTDNITLRVILRVAPLIPMAVSSVVIGLGITYLIKTPSPIFLVLAQSFMYWPFAFRQISPSLAKIKQSTIDADLMITPSRTFCIFNIFMPYSKKSLLSSLAFCFAMSAGDSTIPLLLALRNYDTLSLFTYRLASSYKTNLSCASGLILAFICMTLFAVSDYLKKDN